MLGPKHIVINSHTYLEVYGFELLLLVGYFETFFEMGQLGFVSFIRFHNFCFCLFGWIFFLGLSAMFSLVQD